MNKIRGLKADILSVNDLPTEDIAEAGGGRLTRLQYLKEAVLTFALQLISLDGVIQDYQ
jgi:hypothetical protein